MSLQETAYWTPNLVVVESSHHSQVAQNNVLWELYSILSDFAGSLLNNKYCRNKVEIYVFKKSF